MGKNLTKKEFLEDFNFLYEILKRYYPYFDINKEVNKIDWLGNKERYREKIAKCRTDKSFYNTINFEILNELNNGHTHILPWEMAIDMYLYYRDLEEPNWRLDLARVLEKPRVVERNKITDENIEKIIEIVANYEEEEDTESNVTVGDIIPGDTGYIEIKQMIHPDFKTGKFKCDYDTIKAYLEDIREYSTLIIDIRGNDGGDSKYWTDFLMPLIVDREYKQKTYMFIKEGDLLKNVKKHYKFEEYINDVKLNFNFPKETLDILNDFAYFAADNLKVGPHKESINFKGKIYLLIDKEVYSSSEMLAFFSKETRMATLVGEKTSGDGIGSDPMLIDLPNSRFVLIFLKEMGVT